MINGFTALALTKLDILSELDSIKIGVNYIHENEPLHSVPADLDILKDVTVEYIEVSGWKCDISAVRKYQDLPQNAKTYVATVEKLLGGNVKFKWIGVGKSREAIINV